MLSHYLVSSKKSHLSIFFSLIQLNENRDLNDKLFLFLLSWQSEPEATQKLGSGKKTLAPAQKILAPSQKRLAPGSSGAATLQNEANKSEKSINLF